MPSTRLSHIGRSDKKMEAQLLAMKLQIGYLRAREDSDPCSRGVRDLLAGLVA